MSTRKQRLRPLCAAWMVSPSTPFLELHYRETDTNDCTYVQFIAYNLLHDRHLPEDGTETRVVSSDPPEFLPQRDVQIGPYRLVRLRFVNALAARVSPSFNDTQVIDEASFDWSLVPGACNPDQDIFEYLEEDKRRWFETGVCQNPGVYEVEQSAWLAEQGLADKHDARWHHFLVLGHDSYVEVIAKGLDVQEGQVLENW